MEQPRLVHHRVGQFGVMADGNRSTQWYEEARNAVPADNRAQWWRAATGGSSTLPFAHFLPVTPTFPYRILGGVPVWV